MTGIGASGGLAVLGLLALLVFAPGQASAQAAGGGPADPVQVYYPRSDCRGDSLELEVWSRDAAEWLRHPTHPVVPLESCQVEDAGILFNEIRWRCVEPPESDPPPNWVVGLEVFDPAVMESCSPAAVADAAFGDLELHVESPAPGARVSEPEMAVAVEGSVRMDGVDGTDYDVLLVIDRSSATREDADLLAAQVEAGRRLVERLAPRLGPVRIGLAAYPNMPPRPGSPGGTSARRELAFSNDAGTLHDALDRIRREGASGFQTFGSALDFALAELTGELEGSSARPRARRVLVMAAHARNARPFGHAAAGDARFLDALAQRLQRAQRAHVSLHFFGMGGLAEELSPEVESLFAAAEARFRRVLRPALVTPFFAAVSLPRVTDVVLENRTTGGAATRARVTPSGRFATTLVAAAGTNRIWARATLSDGATTEREWAFEFDDRLVRERLLAAEREYMRRARRKHLTIRPLWDEELPPVPEELEEDPPPAGVGTPDVAAEPPR